jgi:hypothetical protein
MTAMTASVLRVTNSPRQHTAKSYSRRTLSPAGSKLIESVVITYRGELVSNPQLTKASLLFIKLIAIETHLEL